MTKPKIKPIGIADLKVVKQTLVRYAAGEVAHIENVMATESRGRHHRRLRQMEETISSEFERTEESKRDLQTTERFEMQQETQKTIQSETRFQVGAEISAGFGPVQIGVSTQFSTSNSKTESDLNAVNYAKEVVEHSLESLVERVREERVIRTLDEFEEKNYHQFENTDGENKSGIYRWVDKYYRAKVVNYGKRLYYEFMVPEPAAFYIFSRHHTLDNEILPEEPLPPVDPGSNEPLGPHHITRTNYLALAQSYGADEIAPPPRKEVIVSRVLGRELTAEEQWVFTDSELEIPPGYVYGNSSWYYTFGGAGDVYRFSIHRSVHVLSRDEGESTSNGLSIPAISGMFPIGVRGHGIGSLMISIAIVCKLTQEYEDEWRLKTYQTIMAAYNKKRLEYEERLAAAQVQEGVEIGGNNPLLNRTIEKEELKKGCITLWTGFKYNAVPGITHNTNANVPNNYPEIHVDNALEMTPEIQFLEQSFDWKNMTYEFYPYYWGRKKYWLDIYPIKDNDPLFADFLRAGAARVLVPVRIEATKAILFYQLTGKMWPGGDVPQFDPPDPSGTVVAPGVEDNTESEFKLYKDYVAELQNESMIGDINEDIVIAPDDPEAWMFKVPTTLVWLQSDMELPDLEAGTTEDDDDDA
ncbi:hypothetical protein [Legionella parisiensis]|uniref:Uncharacterized protein n=1 Tax=Legionella parisiensis TaxID=45071 RepID=A0A1E5JU40_9GAMM|nr:hypothetical protein [Legionella parisiensis]KTD43110.1 hypothetical protein Lpar_1087 [Legionella parisiensis]OEH47990.1 hypothetical protein lpari_01014 [Legionella parisiensis]STX77811.1 Uncharacterised protein [Legionella parisiensis]